MVAGMKNAVKKSNSLFSGLWGKAAPAPKPKRRVKSQRSVDVIVEEKMLPQEDFSGPPDLVAAHLLWGPNRLWPQDVVSENSLPWQAGEGTRIGILGASLGGWADVVANKVPTAEITEFDWRPDVSRWRLERDRALQTDKTFHEVNMGVMLPPPIRCGCMLGVEPIFTQAGADLLRWARLALEPGGTLILEELATDSPTLPLREIKNGWMARSGAGAQWLRLDEQEAILRRNGFVLGPIRERTGAHLRALRKALDEAEQRLEPLQKAMKQAPELKSVADHFNCEQKAAKNRLKALERGALAVYRIEVIKPRADELI
ncbi:MAG: hypothetical protein COA84_00595 [Robiginitomaculum sp.]|nr:MAG: hypothetical protein COA84_00595 [Robiginitomaculum sp.]